MRVTFDPSADAAYLYLADIGPGEVRFTQADVQPCVDGRINLDFDGEGRLIGIEILNATNCLPAALLASAHPP